MVPVPFPAPVLVPVPALYLDHKKYSLKKENLKNIAFLHSQLFYKEKIDKFHLIYCKMWMKKILYVGNQIHNFILCM
jgi:hypothetical protein